MISSLFERYGAHKVDEEYINIKDIEVGMMPRKLKEEWVKNLVELVEAGNSLPPIRVARKRGGKYELLDGFHRLEAYRRSEALMIPAEIWSVDEEYIPAVKIAFNLEHGLPLTREEKFENFKVMVQKYRDWSNRDFAEALCVGVRTIERWKQKLGLSQEIRKLTEEDKKKIVEMAEEGHGPREIAREFGVAPSRVVKILETADHEKEKNLTIVHNRQMADMNNSETTVHKPEKEEVILDLTEEDDDLEELEREVIEEIEREKNTVIKVERTGEKLYKMLDELLNEISSPEKYEAMKDYVKQNITVIERQLLAEHLRMLLPRFHDFIGFLISKGGVTSGIQRNGRTL